MHNDEQAIRTFYAAYIDTFHTLDAKAVANFYAAPCLFVTDTAVVLMSTAADIEKLFGQLIEQLKARDYDHSDIPKLEVERLSPHLAQVSGLAIRYAKDGNELERIGATYTLRKTGDSWHFVTAVAFPADGEH
jgi:ketosteroid isomerase-like protein